MSRRSLRLAVPVLVASIAAVLCCQFGAGAAVAGPADTCNAVRDFVGVGLCTSHLRSVPGASSTDRRGHLLMTVDLATGAGTKAGEAAAALARGERDPAARDGLEACGVLYGSASVPALRFLRRYAAAGSWAASKSLLLLTMQAGIGCDAMLGGAAAAKGRMAAANTEFSQLATMSTALVNLVS